jgi:SAM-dependent methyltransferase
MEFPAGTRAPSAFATDRKLLLTLGCGVDVHPAFINIDLIPGPGVMVHDLRQGIPFPESVCDLVYHATLLSHFRPADALRLMAESHRVLKPGGVLRVVTEDLEQMCRVYLQKLESAWSGDPSSTRDYDWMVLELYDQATRDRSGGAMREYLNQVPLPNELFIYSRIGSQGRRMVSQARAHAVRTEGRHRSDVRSPLRRAVGGVKRLIVARLLGKERADALEVGRFRLSSGQNSYRMYDRYSLRELFRAGGFINVSQKTASESSHPLWAELNLDVLPTGEVVRPHCLIMEGVREPSGAA